MEYAGAKLKKEGKKNLNLKSNAYLYHKLPSGKQTPEDFFIVLALNIPHFEIFSFIKIRVVALES